MLVAQILKNILQNALIFLKMHKVS